ncbi:lipid-A-disaccharide synthase [uncultured Methylibium sp.]|uniref:lipid-A-disaccharide synthase n=1 Tax=uncultured Methylibium sp. TaxID=381093 RepID=UPI0025F09698|nr:lipid-A-disaccharide synthase [uncultured Methylibium sp.]
MVAGEASGDLLAGLLMGGLRSRWPGLQMAGIGGPKMAAQGFEAWWPSERLAVHGYAEALRVYRQLVALRRELGDRLLADRPAAFVGIDAPDFNLGLEARLKAAGMKTIHFVCPSIWAWRGGRVHKLAASADHVLCLFPFEPALLEKAGVPASYVGHPLADAIPLEVPRSAARSALGLGAGDVVVAVLPGSRRGEVRHIAPAFVRAAQRLRAARPELRCLLPIAPGLRTMIEAVVADAGAQEALQLVDGHSHEVLAASDAAMVASGTATLEAALFKRPMVIGYRMAWLSWQLMRRMRYQPWVGLPNVLAGDFIVPELLQDEMTPEALASAVLRWLDDRVASEGIARRFDDIHLSLRRDTARAATDAIAQILEA